MRNRMHDGKLRAEREPIRMSARSEGAEPETKRAGLVDMLLRSRADVIDFYQVLEDPFDRSGIDDTCPEWLCKSFQRHVGPDARPERLLGARVRARPVSMHVSGVPEEGLHCPPHRLPVARRR